METAIIRISMKMSTLLYVVDLVCYHAVMSCANI